MAESDLSNEVNATTTLPAATGLSASVSSGEVTLSWTNNDDSSDGSIDVERSQDGFNTITTVASVLSPSRTSYTDTSVSSGDSYDYRIERNTDHATANSSIVSVTVNKNLERSATLTSDGAITSSRSATTNPRTATVDGGGTVNATRVTAKARSTTLTADGDNTATRGTISKPRSPTVAGDGAIVATRGPKTVATRQSILTGGGMIVATRAVDKHRTATLTADGAISAVGSTAKTRSSILSGDGSINAKAQFRESFPSELTRDIEWDYNVDRLGFESEWVYREAGDGHGSVVLYLEGRLGSTDPITPSAVIDFDADGDGNVDARSMERSTPAVNQPVVFPTLPGETGYYRILLKDLRPADLLVAAVVGPSHT